MIDAVLSVHANPHGCGVTKFNMQLAQRLGVPHRPMMAPLEPSDADRHVLVSIKPSELLDTSDIWWLSKSYDLLLHERAPWILHHPIGQHAKRIFYADAIGCPSTLQGDPTRPGITIFSFGMATKLQAPLFERLRQLLDDHGTPYTVAVSLAIHDGMRWDEAMRAHETTLRDIFGTHLRWLGFLGDDAVARELREAHWAALFYQPAARANNTTLWAALDAGTPVITNLDADSPTVLRHDHSVCDIAQMTAWPEYDGLRQDLRAGGTRASAAYGWDRVLNALTAEVSV